jgi:hypothetical protein
MIPGASIPSIIAEGGNERMGGWEKGSGSREKSVTVTSAVPEALLDHCLLASAVDCHRFFPQLPGAGLQRKRYGRKV